MNFYSNIQPLKETISVTHLVQGLGNLITKVRCRIHQLMIGCSENIERISKSVNNEFSNGDGKRLCYLMP